VFIRFISLSEKRDNPGTACRTVTLTKKGRRRLLKSGPAM